MNDFDSPAKKSQDDMNDMNDMNDFDSAANKCQNDKDNLDCPSKKPQDAMNDLILVLRNFKMM
jgi:hypothetical protein